eukprot:jgi/Botrbrau1/15163/Bobra.0149s0028.1
MGRDKFENEDLIKYGFPHDIWFHVGDMSSAHVYLRLPEGKSIEDIPEDTLVDCAQLVKANSIQGNKENNVEVVYTPWANLKKTSAMSVGQVGFHEEKAVKKTKVAKRLNEVVNRLNRTKREHDPDLEKERETWDKQVRAARKSEIMAQKKAETAAKEQAKREADLRSYKHIMQDENMMTRAELAAKYESAQDYEEDFM